MSLNNLPAEIATQIVDEIHRSIGRPHRFSQLVRLRLISRQFDAIISRTVFPRVNLESLRRVDKPITRPVVKWLLLEKAKTLRRDRSPGAFAFILDAASFLAQGKYDPLVGDDDYLDAICRAIVSSNEPTTVFDKLIIPAVPDPSFYNLWYYRRRQNGQEWTRKENPETFYGVLQIACAAGSTRAVESLIASGVDLDHRHRVFGSAMRCAILSNRLASVRKLVENSVEMTFDGEPKPVLLAAAEADRHQIAAFLLSLPNPAANYKGKGGVTTLLWAARRGWTDIVRDLLQRQDIDPDPQTDWKETPLKAAARGAHEEVVRLFTDRQDIEPEFGNGKQSLVYYAVNAGSASVTALLLDRYGIDPNSLVMHNKSILARAAELGHAALVRMLLSRDDVDPNYCKGKHHSPPIIWAALANKIETAKILLEHKGLNLNLEGYPSTILKKLVTRNHVDMAELLLGRKDLSPCVVQQALQMVARSGSPPMLWTFLQHQRVRRDFKDEMEHTVQEAVRAGRDDVLRLVVRSNMMNSEWNEYLKKSWRIQPVEKRLDFVEQRFLR